MRHVGWLWEPALSARWAYTGEVEEPRRLNVASSLFMLVVQTAIPGQAVQSLSCVSIASICTHAAQPAHPALEVVGHCFA